MFYLPRIIWRVLHTKSGVSVSSITDAAIGCQRKMDSIERYAVPPSRVSGPEPLGIGKK